ncbi:MAG: nucleoside deaminase [Ferruginibacter sp.]
MTREELFMQEAITLAKNGVSGGEGGPFGCIIVKEDKIIGRGNNKVLLSLDPTAHAEVIAIRDACQQLQSFQLLDCEIYTSCEPCPMCMGAIYWARPKAIYYACNREDALQIGFDDSFIYDEIIKPIHQRHIPMSVTGRAESLLIFEAWKNKEDKTLY